MGGGSPHKSMMSLEEGEEELIANEEMKLAMLEGLQIRRSKLLEEFNAGVEQSRQKDLLDELGVLGATIQTMRLEILTSERELEEIQKKLDTCPPGDVEKNNRLWNKRRVVKARIDSSTALRNATKEVIKIGDEWSAFMKTIEADWGSDSEGDGWIIVQVGRRAPKDQSQEVKQR